MKWLDDAKKKATDTANDAAARARDEAGKAAAKAAWNQLERKVTGLADGVLSAAEAELAEQVRLREEAGTGGSVRDVIDAEVDDAEEGEDVERAEVEPEGPSAAERQQAALAELARLKGERGSAVAVAVSEDPQAEEPGADEVEATEAPERSAPAVVADAQAPDARSPREESHELPRRRTWEVGQAPVPSIAPRRDPFADAEALLKRAAEARGGEPVFDGSLRRDPSDPMAAARAALQAAAETRGGDEPVELPQPGRRDPTRSAEAALEAAAEARRLAKQGPRAAAREERAREELARLRAQLGRPGPRGDDADRGDEPDPPPLTPRKRRL